MVAAAILAASATASMAAVSLTVGNLQFYIDGCSLTPDDCSNLTLTPQGAGGISISAPGSLVALGQDLSFELFITPLNGAEISSLRGILIGGSGASFGWVLIDANGSGLPDTLTGSGTVRHSEFTPQVEYIQISLDLNAELGGPILSLQLVTVPAPASLMVFLVGLLGLAGFGVARRGQAA
jgi:hypothetical protein